MNRTRDPADGRLIAELHFFLEPHFLEPQLTGQGSGGHAEGIFMPSIAHPDLLDRLFSLGGVVVVPVWLLLAFLPSWRGTQRLATFIVPLLLAVAYVGLLLTAHAPPGSGFNSLEQVARLFSARPALLAGWLHYLAFDLSTGSWESRDAVRLGISRWLVAPCLVLTFLFGPVGLALYLLLRLGMRKQVGEVI